MSRSTFNPATVHAPKPTYSHVCSIPISPTSTLITLAGQVGIDASTNKVPETFAEQVEIALANLDACLVAAGASKADIVKVTHYVVDMAAKDRATRGELYMKYMGGLRPPSTLVGVAALADPEFLYEIEALAVVSK